MGHCELCGETQQFPFECGYCGGRFCSNHRLPENHLCRYARNGHGQQPLNSESIPHVATSCHKPVAAVGRKMASWMKVAVFFIVVLLVMVLAVSFVSKIELTSSAPPSDSSEVSDAYSQGYSAGYLEGRRVGQAMNSQSSWDAASYAAGLYKGNETGFRNGYYNGTSAGYLQGYSVGLAEAVCINTTAESGVYLRNPSYAEMQAFLELDLTDENEYFEDNYTCFDYAKDVVNHAFEHGLICGSVYIEFPDSAHEIVCFNTTNRGLIYIEPQTDQPVTLTIGQHYAQDELIQLLNLLEEIDDTVIRFGIIW
jgi:hypothetical protein